MPKKLEQPSEGEFFEWMEGRATALQAFDWLLANDYTPIDYTPIWLEEIRRFTIRRRKGKKHNLTPGNLLRLQRELGIWSKEDLDVLRKRKK